MDRRSLSLRWPLVVMSLAVLCIAVTGCKSAIETVAMVVTGNDTSAEFAGLKGKKVAVVCRPIASQEFSSSGAARALAEEICERLKAHYKNDIHLVEQRKVDKLVDENGMEDYLAIGKALKAEKVVAVDIESFSVLDGQTLFRGRSTVSVQVYDVAEKNVEWRKRLPQIQYPRNSSTPASDVTEPDFRNKFVSVLAEQISRLFYGHDPHDDYGVDAESP